MRAAIRARDVPISFEELHENLLDHEAYLKREEAKKCSLTITAHFNQKGSYKKGKDGIFDYSIQGSNSADKGYQSNSINFFQKSPMVGNFDSFNLKSTNMRPLYRNLQYGNGPSRIVFQLCDLQRCAALDLLHIMHQPGLKLITCQVIKPVILVTG